MPIAVKLLSGMLDRHAAGHHPAVPGSLPSREPGHDTGNGDDAASRQAVPVPARPVTAPPGQLAAVPPAVTKRPVLRRGRQPSRLPTRRSR